MIISCSLILLTIDGRRLKRVAYALEVHRDGANRKESSHEALIAACNRVAEQLKPVPSMEDTDIWKDAKEDPWS